MKERERDGKGVRKEEAGRRRRRKKEPTERVRTGKEAREGNTTLTGQGLKE